MVEGQHEKGVVGTCSSCDTGLAGSRIRPWAVRVSSEGGVPQGEDGQHL